MWFTARGRAELPSGDVVLTQIAQTNNNNIASNAPDILPITTIARFNQFILRPLNFVPPVVITGTGGVQSLASGFIVHTFTAEGNSSLTFTRA